MNAEQSTGNRNLVIILLLLAAAAAAVIGSIVFSGDGPIYQPSLFGNDSEFGGGQTFYQPKCPTNEQRQIIDDNLDSYWRLTNTGYDATAQANRLVAMARTLGQADAAITDMATVSRFLRQALQMNCPQDGD